MKRRVGDRVDRHVTEGRKDAVRRVMQRFSRRAPDRFEELMGERQDAIGTPFLVVRGRLLGMTRRLARRKLSYEEAAQLRRMYHDPAHRETMRTMAHLFRVSEGTVQNVLDRKGAYEGDPR